MINHVDKGILEIRYNNLDLPKYIKFNNFVTRTNGDVYSNTSYSYRADGVKIKKLHHSFTGRNRADSFRTTEYIDGFQYDNQQLAINGPVSLKFFSTSEGYYDYVNNRYIYHYSDHLGNVRVSFAKENNTAVIIEKNEYYAFGLKQNGNSINYTGIRYNYQYNGKEFQDEIGMYDYGARFYMPDLGRWGVVDPLAEVTPHLSPYHYANNNPLMYNDPTGMLSQSFINNIWNSSSGTTWYNTGSGFISDGGNAMDYDGNRINWGADYTDMLMMSVGLSPMGGGGGSSDVEGEIRLAPLMLGNSSIFWGIEVQNHHNAFMERWNSRSDFYWDRMLNAGRYNDGPIQYVGGAGDPWGMWQAGGMALSASGDGNSNYILAALMITRSGNTGGLKVLNAELGAAKTLNYKSTFFTANPELKGNVVVHHAVEQQVLKRYPGVITAQEMHSLENLRGIPKSINSDVHLSQIRKMWNRFYKQNPNPSKQQLLEQATIIDQKFGSQFLPPLK
ncbi:RHS repeat domain-containing protein [Chryseobacterium sp. 2R14A]|uniref:RHS repeat domain-containing protein n=1 Tax=Chryseobacterium sp. 2R14A TaxID=3380353 RepID=UPI003CF3E31D